MNRETKEARYYLISNPLIYDKIEALENLTGLGMPYHIERYFLQLREEVVEGVATPDEVRTVVNIGSFSRIEYDNLIIDWTEHA